MDFQAFLREKEAVYKFSFQDRLNLERMAKDLAQWGEGELGDLWDDGVSGEARGKQAKEKVLRDLISKYNSIRDSKKSYSDFSGVPNSGKVDVVFEDKDETVLGLCPVASDKTRCCNLLTLDAVKQCGFGCSYCSIQSFYSNGKVVFRGDLARQLERVEEGLESDELYHIGTGQSSDSLMWGNRANVLGDVFDFARRNSNVILELKSKSANVSFLLENDVPFNVLATWSLNPDVIIKNEEHFTSSLDERLEAARAVADRGVAVGFHFHPMIYYSGWESDYLDIVKKIMSKFSPKEVVQISIGTLTFIKPVLKQIRKSDMKTKILQMPLENIAGKFSYPFDTKVKMFSFLYSSFSEEWKKEIFFYLCMEDIALWKPVFGFEYKSNSEFENDMKNSYYKKLKAISVDKIV